MGRAAESLDLVFDDLRLLRQLEPASRPPRRRAAHAGPRRRALPPASLTLRAQGVPAAKLVGGVAMYAYFEGVQPDGPGTKPYPAPLGEATFKELGSACPASPKVRPRHTGLGAGRPGGRFVGYDDCAARQSASWPPAKAWLASSPGS